DFWANRASADAAIKELGVIKETLDQYRAIEEGLATLGKEYNEDLFFETRRKFRELELQSLFRGRYDSQPAIISIYPGAGGDDASDWARMLFEMYLSYAKRRGWTTRFLDDSENRRTVEIKGAYAYGYLKREAGVHRLVRISPFSAQKLRHTSFALVEVVPDLPAQDESKIDIPESDLKWEFSRAGGPGGQNVNKVESAVRVMHLPTGLVAASRAERAQAQNRERALSLLKSKLAQLMEQEKVEELSALRTKVKPEWGSQLRSYVLNPYQLVKDHRTETETSQVDAVLAGDLDKFIESEVELLGITGT
ncbi:MAG TPA: PCRF domain-containing protein, partial [Candidatus Paceibacterota bacterium]|nr:PCRF domain-containing protein [Candidatus Paceibacterota bacterium]